MPNEPGVSQIRTASVATRVVVHGDVHLQRATPNILRVSGIPSVRGRVMVGRSTRPLPDYRKDFRMTKDLENQPGIANPRLEKNQGLFQEVSDTLRIADPAFRNISKPDSCSKPMCAKRQKQA